MIVKNALETFPVCAVFVPTCSGATVRMISRFKPPVWIVAACTEKRISTRLLFSYGVHPIDIENEPGDWSAYASEWLKNEFKSAKSGILISGPSTHDNRANYRMEFLKF